MKCFLQFRYGPMTLTALADHDGAVFLSEQTYTEIIDLAYPTDANEQLRDYASDNMYADEDE